MPAITAPVAAFTLSQGFMDPMRSISIRRAYDKRSTIIKAMATATTTNLPLLRGDASLERCSREEVRGGCRYDKNSEMLC
jgi:hypothetical protein